MKRILAETPPPGQVSRRYPRLHAIDDPSTRRIASMRLHAAGWNAKTSADDLPWSRKTVHRTRKRGVAEGVRGLPNTSRAPKRPWRKVDFTTITTMRRLGHHPGMGAWRVHAALQRAGMRRSPRPCGRMVALNRDRYPMPKPLPTPHTPKPMPFRAAYRHQFWSVDLRYREHQLGRGTMYSMTILEN